jgi:MFS family permease
MTEPARTVSTWAPMRFAVFRALWIAVLVSNIGGYMQTVGAQWLLVNQAHAAILVALVTTADMLPDTLFGLVGGVLADILDRRRLLIAVQLVMGAVAIALAALTFAGGISPALLLIFTFVRRPRKSGPQRSSDRSASILPGSLDPHSPDF